MSAAQPKPFTWVVAFTVDPTWVADGFTLGDERAHDLIWHTLGFATHEECAARVLHAPSALRIARCQGYGPKDAGSGRVVRDILTEAPDRALLHTALIHARNLLDGVAFVAKEGDTARVIAKIDEALAALDGAQREQPKEATT